MTRHNQWKFLDNHRRKAYIRYELRRTLLRAASKSRSLPLVQRYAAHFSLLNLPRVSSPNKIQNRCVVSGRNWNVMRRTQYSRFTFRSRAYFAYLPGVRRSSW